MQMASAIYGPIAEGLGITAPAMHRIAAFAVSILDTIPINGAVIATTTTCKLKMKQSYPAIAMTTVINVAVAMSSSPSCARPSPACARADAIYLNRSMVFFPSILAP